MNPLMSRRRFIRWGGEAVAFSAASLLLYSPEAGALPRPPAALEEKDFLRYCARCSRCIDVCKPLALRPAGILDGFKNLGTPVMSVQECILCMECVRVCHTGALQKVPKEDVDIGCGVIDKKLCWAWLRKKRCKICFQDCPLKAIEMERQRFPVIIEEKCNGCGLCLRRCPTDPKSIKIVYRGARRYPARRERYLVRQPDRLGPPEMGVTVPEEPLIKRIREITDFIGKRMKQEMKTES